MYRRWPRAVPSLVARPATERRRQQASGYGRVCAGEHSTDRVDRNKHVDGLFYLEKERKDGLSLGLASRPTHGPSDEPIP